MTMSLRLESDLEAVELSAVGLAPLAEAVRRSEDADLTDLAAADLALREAELPSLAAAVRVVIRRRARRDTERLRRDLNARLALTVNCRAFLAVEVGRA